MNYKQIIQRELDVFTKAYPENRKLLKKFANKIKLEIELNEKSAFPKCIVKMNSLESKTNREKIK